MSEFGKKVKAYPLNGPDGPVVGFVLDTNGADGKDLIQVGDSKYPLAYRAPADYDENGPNGTYCHLNDQ